MVRARGGLLALTAVLLVSGCSASSVASTPSPATTAPASSTAPSSTPSRASSPLPSPTGDLVRRAAAIYGSWRPVSLYGKPTAALAPQPERELVVSFSPLEGDTGWSGTDGCNTTFGPYTVSAAGVFTATAAGTTQVACRLTWPENVMAVTEAKAVYLADDDSPAATLWLQDAKGQSIGVYERIPLPSS